MKKKIKISSSSSSISGDSVIRIEGLYKKFCRNLKRSMLYGSTDITRSMLGLSYDQSKLRKDEFWALNNVSFELKRGESLGIIGANGSGKSTLLRILNGIFPPDKGVVTIRGRMGALISLGAGFHPHMTGRENIYLNGTILGLNKDEINNNFDRIVSFADIGDFLDAPVSTYSSGMTVRLGFAIAIHSRPDILLIDEVLAVGDFGFQKKCIEEIDSKIKEGVTIIFISHSMASVQRLCSKCMLLNHGEISYSGDVLEAVTKYYQTVKDEKADNRSMPQVHSIIHKSEGHGALELIDIQFLDSNLNITNQIKCGDYLRILLAIQKHEEVASIPPIAIRIIDYHSQELMVNIQTPTDFFIRLKIEKQQSIICDIPNFILAPGYYQFEIKIGGDGADLHDIALVNIPLEVGWSRDAVDNMSYKGKVFIPGVWSTS